MSGFRGFAINMLSVELKFFLYDIAARKGLRKLLSFMMKPVSGFRGFVINMLSVELKFFLYDIVARKGLRKLLSFMMKPVSGFRGFCSKHAELEFFS